jgi:hypothetical protein
MLVQGHNGFFVACYAPCPSKNYSNICFGKQPVICFTMYVHAEDTHHFFMIIQCRFNGGPVNRRALRRGFLIIYGVNWAALEQILAFKICVRRFRVRLFRKDRAALKFDEIRARTRYAEHLFKII